MNPRMRLAATKIPRPVPISVLVACAFAVAILPAVPDTASAAAGAAVAGAAKSTPTRAKKRELTTCPGAKLAQVTVSPLPGTPDASPQSQISFLGTSASQLHSIHVIGSVSGRHAGRLRSYDSATGASFLPSTPFAAGGAGNVCGRGGGGQSVH